VQEFGTEFAKVCQWLDSQSTSMRNLVEATCNINSYTLETSGVDQVREIFRLAFSDFGALVSEVEIPDFEIVNSQGILEKRPLANVLHVVQRPAVGKQCFLCIHLDTVYEPTSAFQTCFEQQPGIMVGPGVIDAKGGAVIMLFALRALERSSLRTKLGWEVVLNSDEEIGSPSSQKFIKSRARQCDFGLLFEPALPDGTLVDRRKGSGNFSLIARGKSVHSGRDFEKGRNAVIAAADIALELHRLNEEHPEVTINVARIDGGGPLNVVPDLAIVRVNARVDSAEQQEWFEMELDRIAKKWMDRDGITCELHGAFFSPPKNVDGATQRLKEAISATARDLDLPIAWRNTGGASDGNKLAAVGVPNIDTMGARGGEIHSSDEYLLIDSLAERAKLTALVLMRYAAGDFSLD
jgi:glutamate carboxypeptidase